MRIIAITEQDEVAGEVCGIKALISSGTVWRVHIRKPGWSSKQMITFLEHFTELERRSFSVHSHYEEALALGVGGVHCTSYVNTEEVEGFIEKSKATEIKRSASCHSFHDVEVRRTMDYVMLSPIFSSISKIAEAAFSYNAIRLFLKEASVPTFALGGISPETVGRALELGFSGVASLGYIWQENNPTGQVARLIEGMEYYETMRA